MTIFRILGGGLRSILSRGVERVLGRLISRALPLDAVSAMIRSRHPALTQVESEDLARFVRQGQNAGDLIDRLPDSAPLPVEEMPVNELLPESVQGANRYIIDTDVDIVGPDGEILRRFGHITLEDVEDLDMSQVREAISNMAIDKFFDTDERAVNFNREEVRAVVRRTEFAERGF